MSFQLTFLVLVVIATYDVTQAGKSKQRLCGRNQAGNTCTDHSNCQPPDSFCVMKQKDTEGVCCDVTHDLDKVCKYGDAEFPQSGYCDVNTDCPSSPAAYCDKHPLGRWAVCCPACASNNVLTGNTCTNNKDCVDIGANRDYCGGTGVCCTAQDD